jgi:hypothetical protein
LLQNEGIKKDKIINCLLILNEGIHTLMLYNIEMSLLLTNSGFLNFQKLVHFDVFLHWCMMSKFLKLNITIYDFKPIIIHNFLFGLILIIIKKNSNASKKTFYD